ncbi:Streptavidin-V1 [Trichoplax sp. H2]|nr:Streptavidin-V1 [Trichoplax sp. H2]|eukprot:RDD44170.1 Streptavidin-V1 [Trichoplax sp. H2]
MKVMLLGLLVLIGTVFCQPKSNKLTVPIDKTNYNGGVNALKNSTTGFLSGFWFNQHGSVLFLHHRKDGFLAGSFRTLVESTKGAAGRGGRKVRGNVAHPKHVYTKDKPVALSFSVAFDGGSTTAWSGEYQVCDDTPLILTTWILTKPSRNCDGHWASTLIGKDTFKRKPYKARHYRKHLKFINKHRKYGKN